MAQQLEVLMLRAAGEVEVSRRMAPTLGAWVRRPADSRAQQ